MTRTARLGQLFEGLGARVMTGADVEVSGIAVDSRSVRPGDVFFALPGLRDDGRRYVAEALARGARAVVASDVAPEAPGWVVVRAEAARHLLGCVAARLAEEPTAGLTLVGVTGTNGKTTTTYLLEAIWQAAGFVPGIVGTIEYRYPGTRRPAPFTTPEAPMLQELLAEMRQAGATHVVMEVSSHALVQERVTGCRFDAAVFTNLTRDHLDFHGDLEAYYAAKARLFLEHLPAGGKPDPVAIVNTEDPHGGRLHASVRTRAVSFGHGREADVHLEGVETTLHGIRGVLVLGAVPMRFTSPLIGAPHAENVLAAEIGRAHV